MTPNPMKYCLFLLGGLWLVGHRGVGQEPTGNWADKFTIVLNNTAPLEHSRDGRLPLYLWPTIEPGDLSEQDALQLVKALDARGVALFGAWKKQDSEQSLSQALTVLVRLLRVPYGRSTLRLRPESYIQEMVR